MVRIPFRCTEADSLELAARALTENNPEKSIAYLKEALAADGSSRKVRFMLAEVYSTMGAPMISNAVLFKTLRETPEDERPPFNSLLAFNFLQMGDRETAEYYFDTADGDYDESVYDELLSSFTDEAEEEGFFSIAYPRGNDYYKSLIRGANEKINDGDILSAIETLKSVPPESVWFEEASHMVTVACMLRKDFDGVIDNAVRALSKKDILALRCTLVTAYLMEDKKAEAAEALNGILKKGYTSQKDVLLLLPLLVNMNEHGEIMRYAQKIKEPLALQPNIMMWLSEAYYNMGRKAEAMKTMRRAENLYGEYTAASYYIQLYQNNVSSVAYGVDPPLEIKVEIYGKYSEYMKMNRAEFVKASKTDEFRDLTQWVFAEGNDAMVSAAITKLGYADGSAAEWIKEMYRCKLVTFDLDFGVMSMILRNLVHLYNETHFEIVAQDRYKTVDIVLPGCYDMFPPFLAAAVQFAVCDIIFTDEEPQYYLDILFETIDRITIAGEHGEMTAFGFLPLNKLTRLRSAKTLAGVLLSKVYEDDYDPDGDCIARYGLNEKTFVKYYTLIFGAAGSGGEESKTETEAPDDDKN